MPKVKVWSATHPDEKFPLRITDSLLHTPVGNISVGHANTLALARDRRVANVNMNIAYPGDPNSDVPEERRAAEVLTENSRYDIVVDLHGAQYQSAPHACIDSSRPLTPRVFDFLAHVGMRHIIDCSTINTMLKHTDNGFVLELRDDDPQRDVTYWCQALDVLANGDIAPASPGSFDWYRFAADVTHQQRAAFNLPERIDPFDPLPPSASAPLGFPDQTLYSLFWGNPDPVWCGEVVTSISCPIKVL